MTTGDCPAALQTVSMTLDPAGGTPPVPLAVLPEGALLGWDKKLAQLWNMDTESGELTKLRDVPKSLEAPRVCDMNEAVLSMLCRDLQLLWQTPRSHLY